MDRNDIAELTAHLPLVVALRKESVDRNGVKKRFDGF